jgi:tryptophan-rich sensory protein
MAILVGTDETALMIALVFGLFASILGLFHSFSRDTRAWYLAGSKLVKISPPQWLFFIAWPIMYVLEVAAMYRYVVHQSSFPGTHYDSVVLLFLVQAVLCFFWHPLFFQHKRVYFTGIVIIVVLIAQLGCLGIMGADEEWVSFALMLIVFFWCLYLGILNFYWVHIVRTHKTELSKYDENCDEYWEEDIIDSRRGRTTKKVENH